MASVSAVGVRAAAAAVSAFGGSAQVNRRDVASQASGPVGTRATLRTQQHELRRIKMCRTAVGECGTHSKRGGFTLRVVANDEFGARDPTPKEIESNFGDKVLGFAGTEHVILIPTNMLGLAEKSCTPLPPGATPLSEAEAKALLRKVVGWRLVKSEHGFKIGCEWKIKDAESGKKLFERIGAVAEAEGHQPELHLEGESLARAEIWSSSIGGLSENDYILAAKIDRIETSDLIRKNKFWA